MTAAATDTPDTAEHPIPAPPALAWTAAGLSVGASLLHWAGGENQTHLWSLDALLLVGAASAQVLLAMLLVLAPWHDTHPHSDGTESSVYLAGAALNAAILIGFTLPLLLGQPADGGQGVVARPGINAVEAAAAGMEAALVGLLLWLSRRTGRPHPDEAIDPVAGSKA